MPDITPFADAVATRPRRRFRRSLALAAALGLAVGARSGLRDAVPDAAVGPVRAQSTALGGPAYALPALNHLGDDDICESWIAVQNVGDRAGQPVAVYWRVHSGPPPAAPAAPDGIVCGGLVRPGAHWNFYGAQVATGSRSGLVFSLDGTPLTAAGADPAAEADAVGSWLCERLAAEVGADVGRWRTFYGAWLAGDAWQGVPLGRLAGPPLKVSVLRRCPGHVMPGADTSSAYVAPAVGRDRADRHRAVVPPLAVGRRPGRSASGQLHVQNVGRDPGTFEMWLQSPGGCDPTAGRQSVVLEPGDAAAFGLGEMASADAAVPVVEGSQPFVVAALDVHGDASVEAVRRSHPVGTAGAAGGGALAAIVPLHAGPHRVSIDVANDGAAPVTPRVTRYGGAGRRGGPAAPPAVGDPLCPGGVARTVLTVTAGALEPHLFWIDTADGAGAAALSASVEVASLGDDGAVRAAYRIEARRVDPLAALAAAPPLALPAAFNDLFNSGIGHVVAVARTGDADGAWSYVLDTFDHNGHTGRICRTLGGGASADIVDLAAQPGLPPGTKAAAVVAGVAWTGEGAPGDLVATALALNGTTTGQDIPGDEAAAVAAQPIDGPWTAGGAPCGPVAEPAPPPPAAAPHPPLAAAAFLPVLGNLGQDAVCTPRSTVTNHGTVPAALVRIRWGEPGFCDPDCAPPLAVDCLPLLAPGASVVVDEWLTAASGVVLSLNDRSLADLGVSPGDQRTAAQALCGDVALAETCHGWRRLWTAWQGGNRYAGLPLAAVVGPAIGVELARDCPYGPPPARASSRVVAPSAAAALAGETRPDRFVYTVPDVLLPSGVELGSPLLYLQNAGTRCASVVVSFVAADGAVTRCDISMLSAGEAYALDVNDCISPPWQGAAVIAADAPLAIAIDRDGPAFMTTRAMPGAVVPPASTAGPVVPTATAAATVTAPAGTPTASASPTSPGTAPAPPTATPAPGRRYIPIAFMRGRR